MVKYLSFHISCFAFKILFNVNGKAIFTRPSLCGFGETLVTGLYLTFQNTNRWTFMCFVSKLHILSFMSFKPFLTTKSLLDNMWTLWRWVCCAPWQNFVVVKRVPNWYAFLALWIYIWCEEWEFKKHNTICYSRGGGGGKLVEWYNVPSIISCGCIQSLFFFFVFSFWGWWVLLIRPLRKEKV